MRWHRDASVACRVHKGHKGRNKDGGGRRMEQVTTITRHAHAAGSAPANPPYRAKGTAAAVAWVALNTRSLPACLCGVFTPASVPLRSVVLHRPEDRHFAPLLPVADGLKSAARSWIEHHHNPRVRGCN